MPRCRLCCLLSQMTQWPGTWGHFFSSVQAFSVFPRHSHGFAPWTMSLSESEDNQTNPTGGGKKTATIMSATTSEVLETILAMLKYCWRGWATFPHPLEATTMPENITLATVGCVTPAATPHQQVQRFPAPRKHLVCTTSPSRPAVQQPTASFGTWYNKPRLNWTDLMCPATAALSWIITWPPLPFSVM